MYLGETEVNTPENEAARAEYAEEIKELRESCFLSVQDRFAVSDCAVFSYGFKNMPLNFLAFYANTLRKVIEDKAKESKNDLIAKIKSELSKLPLPAYRLYHEEILSLVERVNYLEDGAAISRLKSTLSRVKVVAKEHIEDAQFFEKLKRL